MSALLLLLLSSLVSSAGIVPKLTRISDDVQTTTDAISAFQPDPLTGNTASSSCIATPDNPKACEKDRPIRIGSSTEDTEALDGFYFSGGAWRSFYPPEPVSGENAAVVNASDFWGSGWEGEAYAWNISQTVKEEEVVCLCEMKEWCGCGPGAWRDVKGFDGEGKERGTVWVVNGTAGWEEMEEEKRLKAELEQERTDAALKKKQETEAAAAEEEGDEAESAGARIRDVVSWGMWGFVAAGMFAC